MVPREKKGAKMGTRYLIKSQSPLLAKQNFLVLDPDERGKLDLHGPKRSRGARSCSRAKNTKMVHLQINSCPKDSTSKSWEESRAQLERHGPAMNWKQTRIAQSEFKNKGKKFQRKLQKQSSMKTTYQLVEEGVACSNNKGWFSGRASWSPDRSRYSSVSNRV